MIQGPDPSSKSFFRTARYRLFWVSSLFSNMGTMMQQIAQPWVLLSLNSSPFWVGLDSFALNAPSLCFTLFGGVLADRFDRKKTVLFFQTIQFLCVLSMILLLVLGLLKVWIIVLISFLIGLTDSLSMPSFQSIIPSLVRPGDIPRAVSFNSAQFNLSRTLGPAIAGVVIVRFGVLACFGANAVSYIPFFLSLYFICPRGSEKLKKEPPAGEPLKEIQQFRTLFRNREVRLPLLTTFVNMFFCGPLITFCAVLIRNVFQESIENFGGAMAAFGIGGLLGAASSFFVTPGRFRRNEIASGFAVLMGLLVLIISLNHSLVLLILLLVLAGAALTASNIFVNSFLQENTTNLMRGRIASLFQLAISGGISIGALFTGLLVAQFGISTALTIDGLLALCLQLTLFRQQIRNSSLKK